MDIEQGVDPIASSKQIPTSAMSKDIKDKKVDEKENDGRECPKIFEGLEGVVVAKTRVCTMTIPHVGLTYRGYKVTELIEKSSFEEVSLLLILGHLPTATQLQNYKVAISSGRKLSPKMKKMIEILPLGTHPMDVIRCCISMKGALDPSHRAQSSTCNDVETISNLAGEVLGLISSCIVYWFNFALFGNRLFVATGTQVSTGEHFLRGFCHDIEDVYIDSFNKSLIAYAEHDLNASTFAARVTASTLSDYYSCILSGVNTLKGPLHGGANEAALKMLKGFDGVESVVPLLTHMLVRKEKVMGFGHRVYKNGDPRSDIMKQLVKSMIKCENLPRHCDLGMMEVAETLEKEMIARKNIYPNLDFYAALIYHLLGIPESIFTVIFAMARVSGWSAHIKEQLSNNKLIRPKSHYDGEMLRSYPENRKH